MKLFVISVLIILINMCCCNGNVTLAPTMSNVTPPGIATLRPTSPTMPPIMLPGSDPDMPENKTEELPIVGVYFIMFGITCAVTSIGIGLDSYGIMVLRKKRKVFESW